MCMEIFGIGEGSVVGILVVCVGLWVSFLSSGCSRLKVISSVIRMLLFCLIRLSMFGCC